jgi:transcriptional regulator with XRE-family HTH domain
MPRTTRKRANTSNPKLAFGIVLRALREQRGFSQDSFAHLSGYHRNYIGQLERGEKSPSLSALFNLSEALKLRPSQLVKMIEQRQRS